LEVNVTMWILLAIGCGGSSVDLNVAGSQRLAELDEQQSCDLFQGFADYFERTTEASCYLNAQGMSMLAGDDAFRETCEAAYDVCVEQSSLFTEEVDCATVENNIPASCDATVRDAERCLSDVLDVIEDAASDECRQAMDLSVLEELMGESMELPDSCDAISDCGLL
jgi:hypothetical protein